MAQTLADVPLGLLWQAQQGALMRMQLYLVSRTHALLRRALADCREALAEAQQAGDGAWDGLATHLAVDGVTKAWKAVFPEWRALFLALRIEAGALPFGTLVRLHQAAFQGMTEAEGTPVTFEPQLRAVLDAASERVWDDGFRLSQRIWRLDQEGLERIRQTVYEGVASGSSAWQIARELEPILGAGGDCPRWARSRLYKLTKSDIASGDRTGLASGDACAGQGIAYNALRLARNELQIAHHRATDEIMGRVPWIEQEQIMLSPAHPEEDICDDVIAGGERGEGIYQRGTIQLPLHVQCLCYKVAVLQKPDAFADRLRGWLRGAERWPAMDEYAGWLGVPPARLPEMNFGMTLAGQLPVWLWGGQTAMDEAVARWLLPGGQLVFPW